MGYEIEPLKSGTYYTFGKNLHEEYVIVSHFLEMHIKVFDICDQITFTHKIIKQKKRKSIPWSKFFKSTIGLLKKWIKNKECMSWWKPFSGTWRWIFHSSPIRSQAYIIHPNKGHQTSKMSVIETPRVTYIATSLALE